MQYYVSILGEQGSSTWKRKDLMHNETQPPIKVDAKHLRAEAPNELG